MEIILEETHYNFFLLFFILKTRERLQKNTNELSLIYLRMKEVRVLIAQLCPTLCDPMDCSPPGSYVLGILRTIILEWVAIPSSGGSFRPRDQTRVSCMAGRFFTVQTTRAGNDI